MNSISKKEKIKITIISGIVFLLAILSITNNSMWVDEICRVFNPIRGKIMDTIKLSLTFAQPGYMLFMYLWERITFGNQAEFLIRCSNLIFVPIAIFYSYKIVKAKKWSLWTILLFFIHPMFVYYMNEATPYIIMYTLALAYTYYVFFSKDFNSTKNIIKINLIYLLGVFTHFIFGFIIIIYLTKCLLENYKNKENLLKHFKILCIFCLIYVPLLIVYMVNLIPNKQGFGIKSVAYIIYGFLGMAGLGLSRNDLRALNFNDITTIQIISLALMAVACLGILYFVIKKYKSIIKEEKEYLICFLAYFGVLFVVASIVSWGVWERHTFTIFPLFMIIFIDILYVIKRNFKISYLFITLYILMLIVSSLNIRFNYYYQCDDYKGVYNFIEENELSNKIVIANYTSDIYNIEDILNENYYDATELSDEEIVEAFINNKDAVLILFEKYSSKKLYNYFDNNKDYKINNNFNSFKIIESIF